jgi:hypothetical protein
LRGGGLDGTCRARHVIAGLESLTDLQGPEAACGHLFNPVRLHLLRRMACSLLVAVIEHPEQMQVEVPTVCWAPRRLDHLGLAEQPSLALGLQPSAPALHAAQRLGSDGTLALELMASVVPEGERLHPDRAASRNGSFGDVL